MRYLLANLVDCPENMHMEQAFLRYFNPGANGALDIVHAFHCGYDFMKPAGNATGIHLNVAGMPRPGDFIDVSAYDRVIFLDIPARKDAFLPFLSLLLNRRIKRKIALTNHLLAMPGQGRGIDAAYATNMLSHMDIAYVLGFEDKRICLKIGFRESALRYRTYHIDCEYYSPPPPACLPDGRALPVAEKGIF